MTSNMTTRLALGALGFLAAHIGVQQSPPREGASHTPASIAELQDRLSSPDPRERAEAACRLSRQHADAAPAIPMLLAVLGDDVRVSGVRCRMEEGARGGVETSPAQEAANALGDIGNPAVPGLLTALERGDPKTRRFAAVALGDVDQIAERPRVVGALIQGLTDGHPKVREHSAWALGEIEDRAAVQPLLSALNDSDPRVRARAAWALGEMEDWTAVTGLTRASQDADPAVREASDRALRELDDRVLDAPRGAARNSQREEKRGNR